MATSAESLDRNRRELYLTLMDIAWRIASTMAGCSHGQEDSAYEHPLDVTQIEWEIVSNLASSAAAVKDRLLVLASEG